MKLHRVFHEGEFSIENKAFVINTPETPRPWTNHLWNQKYLSVFSQNGQGFSLYQDEKGKRIKLAKARMLYLLEESSLKGINGLPVEAPVKDYLCEHHPGYSVISHCIDKLKFLWTCFVPPGESCEIWHIKVTNQDIYERSFNIISALDTAIGERQDITSTSGEWNPDLNALTGSNVIRHGAWFHHATEGEKEKGFFCSSKKPAAYDCRRSAVYGSYGDPGNPGALKKTMKLGNSPAEFENLLFSIDTAVSLHPGDSETFVYINGVWDTTQDIVRIQEKYLSPSRAEKALADVKTETARVNGGATVKTPEQAFDLFINNWLKQQTRFNAAWARIYYNGFRDLCQDNGNMAFINCESGEKQLIETLKRQYSSGYAPRGWCEDELIEQDYADSPVWIINAVHNLVMERGRQEFLLKNVSFCDGEANTVYEHARRALNYLWNDRGPHGLSLIHGGDWNDMLNGAGVEGKGESLWLTMALLHALPLMGELARIMNDTATESNTAARRKTLLQLVETHGWDGDWYRRGFTDSGRPIGSAREREGQCFLNTQAWAIIAGAGKAGRALHALETAEKLLDTDQGMATLSTPYRNFDAELGYISTVRPGTNTNGGIYIHSNAFKVLGDCLLKRSDAAWDSLSKILPFSEARIPVTGPPYSLPNSYMGPESGHRFGDYGGAWITGTAGWVHTIVMNYIFGIRPVWEGLLVEPCLPSHWKKASMSRRFREAEYNITYRQNSSSIEEWKILVDGELYEEKILPNEKGRTYQVELIKE